MRDRLDYLFLLPTYNRFDYLIQVLDRIVEQVGSLSVKIGIVNDFSNDKRYDELTKIYGDILIYKVNEKNYGKNNYYLTVNKLLEIANNNKADKYIFLADDSLPSKNLLKYVNMYTQNGAKVVNIAIHQKELITNWGLSNWVDGGFVITHDTYIKVNQKLENVVRAGYGTGVFREITLRLNKLNIKIHFPKYSLLYHMGHTTSVMHTDIRKNEQIHTYSFIDDVKNEDVFRDEIINIINQKLQISVSDAVRNFKTKMVEKYNLNEYLDTNTPTVFFGMYNENDYKKFLRHTGQKIIIWCGTDALNAKKNKHWWDELKKTVNISMSSFIYKSLSFCGIDSNIVPIVPTKTTLNVKPKGDNIYWYYNSDGKRDFYGGKIINQIKKLTNYNIIEAKFNSFDNDKISEVYESCFLGLRLTNHDGLPNTVVEMGLMGRYCLHNGNTPNSIQYDSENINDIIKKIDDQFKKKNEVDYDIAKKVSNYMSFGDNLNKLFFSFDTIVDNKKIEIIKNNEILRSKQHPIKTSKKNTNVLSIIISTFNNTQYLDKCFNSIIDSIGNKNVEVLVGVDSCIETFNFLIGKFYSHNFKFYFFQKNVGPYIVKNSLSKISNSNDILFFDSDDIMDKNMVGDVIDGLNGYDCVKPVFINFNDGDIININSKKHLGEGVFGVKKSIFNYLNGFEPWMCAADSDFMGRLYKNRYKLRYTNRINFYRRIHKNGLTSRPDTGMSSPLRAQYAKLSRNKKVAGPLKIMVTEPYSLINGVNYLPKMVYDNDTLNVVDPNYELMLKLRKESLAKVFNHENYRVATPVEKIEKKISSINYEKINNLLNKVIPKPIPKVNQVNNTPENKKIITNKEMVKLIFPDKKNRRGGDNTMSFGGKINK